MLEGSLYVSVETHNSNHWPPPQEIPFLDTHWCLGATHQEITDTPQSEKRGEPTLQVQKGKRVTGIVQAAALGDNRRRSTWEEWNKKKKKKKGPASQEPWPLPHIWTMLRNCKEKPLPKCKGILHVNFFFFFFAFHHHRAEFKPHWRSKPNTQWKRAERNRASTDFCNLAIGGI